MSEVPLHDGNPAFGRSLLESAEETQKGKHCRGTSLIRNSAPLGTLQ